MKKKKYKARDQYRPYFNRFHNHPYALPVTAFLLLFFLSIASFIGLNAHTDPPSDSHIIEFSEEGERRSIPSRAKTVGEFLTKINVKLGEHDIVEPGLDSKIDDEKFHINVYRARPVTIVEDSGERKFAYSAAKTPRSIVHQAGIKVYPEDRVEAMLPENFLKEGVLGEKVVIERSAPANINLYGTHVPVRTHAKTVGELLQEKNIKVATKDEVKPSLETRIIDNIQIFVVRPGTKLATVEEEIPMPTEIIEDKRLSFGVQVTRQQGSPGKKAVTYQIVTENGKETGRKKIQEVISVEPVKQIIARGAAVYITSNHAQLMDEVGIPKSQQAAADYIISRESGWCPTKWQGRFGYCPPYYEELHSPSSGYGYGLCQSTPAIKMASAGDDWRTNAVTQLRWCTGYAEGRYGSWQAAYEFWSRNHWW